MQRGPAPADFDTALMAQRAPPKNPPRKIIAPQDTGAPGSREEPVKWTSIQRSAWDQKGRDVDVYVRALMTPVAA